MSFILAPSLLSANFSNLAGDIELLDKGGADWIHVDVMDGHFVPNLSFGPFLLPFIRKHTQLPIDVHLMVNNPDALIPAFIAGGADWITVHIETCQHLYSTLQTIKKSGCKAGVALNPATSIECIKEVVPLLDMVLILGNNPGYSGQGWISAMVNKISRLEKFLVENKSPALIQVDGGISAHTLVEAYAVGARAFVSGSAIFGHPAGIPQGILALRELID